MSDSTFLPIGTLLSRQYKIVQHIGAGGFGKTYLVEGQLGTKKVVKEFFISSMCTRDAATKMVTVSVDENRNSFEQQLSRFKEEARRIYSLSHPNIVKVSALFDENDTAYYVMDYVEGESLLQKCRREKLSEPQIMHYLNQLLSALEYIHLRGITHLDLKPGNVMVDKDDNVVLIDFGASKLFKAQSVNKTMMTSMRPPFTPGYAPIEQENGNVRDMGPHCDIYALGATLYHLYTGENQLSPFEIFQNGLPDIPEASPQMQNVIKRAMVFDKKQRIQNVSEFRAMLGGDIAANVAVNEATVGATQMAPPIMNSSSNKDNAETKPVAQPPIYSPQPPKYEEQLSDDETKKKINPWSIVVIFIAIAILLPVLWVKLVEPTSSVTQINYINDSILVPGTDIYYKMIKVKGGTFKMGSYERKTDSDEKPVHSVTLSDYYIGETEVTQDLWEAVMGSNPSKNKGSRNPVENTSWHDCQKFIDKLNAKTGMSFRLPTEAEWEYAARGGNKSYGYRYSGSNSVGYVAWYDENAIEGAALPSSHEVGTKLPNELGIYDMSGNVSEWCADWKDVYPSSSETNPTGALSGTRRVVRGGSWDIGAVYSRVANRNDYAPGTCGPGLRLVCQ